MKTRIIIGANAYCHIQTETVSIDVLLEPGHGAKYSLIKAANDAQEKADWLISRAKLYMEAAELQ